MIVFDLDGTLADCEHRRHFVDPLKDHPDYYRKPCESCNDGSHHKIDPQIHKLTGEKWKPDWKAFYEACDQDKYIIPAFETLRSLRKNFDIQIWSGRCESIRKKTQEWLIFYAPYLGWIDKIPLKMRPIGDSTPDDVLKEKWLDEYSKSMWPKLEPMKKSSPVIIHKRKDPIDFVFDSDPKSIEMWRRRGIFVFNCAQHDEEF